MKKKWKEKLFSSTQSRLYVKPGVSTTEIHNHTTMLIVIIIQYDFEILAKASSQGNEIKEIQIVKGGVKFSLLVDYMII